MMAAIFGFVVALVLVKHFQRQTRKYRRQVAREESAAAASGGFEEEAAWDRQWADKLRRQQERRQRYGAPHKTRRRRKHRRYRSRRDPISGAPTDAELESGGAEMSASAIRKRAEKRARHELEFYQHLTSYLGVMAMLALINIFTTRYPWFLWPAMGWGIGVFAHYMAVFGSQKLKDRYFYPAVEREVRRETLDARTDKQASIDDLSASIAHEIRNPIAAAKSLVQQMGEDPRSIENVEYANVALDELDRVERSISHLLKYAKEEEIEFSQVNLAGVIDSSLSEMRAKLDAAHVAVARNYIGGPTVVADGGKLRQVFVNILDNAIDSFPEEKEDKRIDLHIENGVPQRVRVRLRDNGDGIAPEKIERIFNPFFTTKETGTGLGMAISKKIVEAHDGRIDVVSEASRGTEFVVELPLPD